MNLRTSINVPGIAGFALAAWFAVVQEWSLPEFCWATWLGGLMYAWLCVFGAAIHIIVTSGSARAACDAQMPFMRRIPPPLFTLGSAMLAFCAALLAFYLYSYLFFFYGLFLSAFTPMEPEALFGGDGFINSGFYTPVLYLLERFWPVAAGLALANGADFFRPHPWKRVLLPIESEIVRIHVFVLAVPFISLIAWAIFGEAYQAVAIVLLMGVLYLMPKKHTQADR